MFKKHFLICSLLLASLPIAGQGWLFRSGKSTVQNVGRQVSRQSGSGLFLHAPSVIRAGVNPGLQDHIQRAITRSNGAYYSSEEIARLVGEKNIFPKIMATPLLFSNIPTQAAKLRNEFLTALTTKPGKLSSQQIREASQILRTDLNILLAGLNKLQQYSTVEEMVEALPHDATVRRALEAVGDVSALGLYGDLQDSELLFRFYDALKDTPLEPLALTAVVRTCVSTHASSTLDSVLAQAPRTHVYEQLATWLREERIPIRIAEKTGSVQPVDLSALEMPLLRESRLAGLHLDASSRASNTYISLRVRQQIQFPLVTDGADATEPLLPIDVEGLSFPSQALKSLDLRENNLSAPSISSQIEQTVASGISPQDMLPVSESGVYEPVIPAEEELPRVNLITKQYPSGLQEEDRLIHDWLEYYRHGYFRPRDQIEAIRGMSAAKANNVMEYFYHMEMEEAERVILNPLREHGRLPDFMYDARLIPGTQRLPAGYYKNKFNENVLRLIELAEEDGTVFTRNVELKDLVTSMEDYSFEQGFAFVNDADMTAALRHNWEVIVNEVQRRGVHANRHLMNAMWRKPIKLSNGQVVSLRLYFTQRSPSAFFKEGRMPEFYLNSPKWVSWENERRNLAAQEYIHQTAPDQTARPWWDKVQDFFMLGRRSSYLTLDQFGKVMTDQYRRTYETAWKGAQLQDLLDDPTEGPSTCTIKVNNFDRPGGVCQAAFSDGGYMGKLPSGYDGTSTVSRFTPIEFKNVPVVGFDFTTLKPQIMTLNTVPYLKDLKTPNSKKLHASIMVRDGLDVTRDLLSVQEANDALLKIPHLKATIYPHSRLKAYEGVVPPFMDGGGLAGYLALFTPDFYPLKKVLRLRFQDGRLRWVPEYFVRKEVPTLAGLVHRDYLTFTYMLYGRSAKNNVVPPLNPEAK